MGNEAADEDGAVMVLWYNVIAMRNETFFLVSNSPHSCKVFLRMAAQDNDKHEGGLLFMRWHNV